MELEARAASCFAQTFVLTADTRAVGKIEGRWLGESLDIYLTGRRHLVFRKVSWLGSQFELVDVADERVLGACGRNGFLSTRWDVRSDGRHGQLARAGWLDAAYEYREGDDVRARVDRLGWCQRGWRVAGSRDLAADDLLPLGLVYHIVLQRQARQHQAGSHAAGS